MMHMCRYGDIFKSHILGCPCVMISSPEAAKSVLVSQSQIFKPTYPPSKERLIGPEAIFFHQGPYHSRLKKLVLSSFQPSALKKAVPHIENIVIDTLSTYENNTINTLQEMKKVCVHMIISSKFASLYIYIKIFAVLSFTCLFL